MTLKFIAYSIEDLKNLFMQRYAGSLKKSALITPEQSNQINLVYQNKLYTPNIFFKILFFLFSLLGLITLSAPLAAILSVFNFQEYQIPYLLFPIGFAVLFFTEKVLIVKKNHFRSGMIEAGLYTGFSLISTSLFFNFDPDPLFISFFGLLFLTIGFLRYLDLLFLIGAFFCLASSLFFCAFNLGEVAQAFLPFIFISFFIIFFLFISHLKTIFAAPFWQFPIAILRTLSLFMIYLAGNYFVVRELSVELLNLHLNENENIPFAYLFYFLTAMIPLLYLYLGIKKRSLLFLRSALLCVALSIITLKIYFSLGAPVVTITLSGAVMILLSLVLFRYLKKEPYGFTDKELIAGSFPSENLGALVISQTLQGPSSSSSEFKGGGGQFGGGGSNGNW